MSGLATISAATAPPAVYDIPRIEEDVRVDAVLDEPSWTRAVVVELPYETDPGENIPARVGTECLLMHDSTRLYAACRALDPEPARIRAHLTDRDTAWSDDWIGFNFDSYNDERRAFQFVVNPLGVQMDGVRDDVNRSKDVSWDAIWVSAGRITDQGYVLELAIPFSQLRFARGGTEQLWGIDIFRHYPRRLTYITSSQPVDRNLDCVLCQISKLRGFQGIEPGRNLEVNPTLTVINTEKRDELDDPLEKTEDSVDLGITARWGVRPNIVLSGTINPDFSQVEADAAELDINRKFTIFFPEKRPFFLEGADYFETPINAVHTRTVLDPAWGIKLTGKEGRNAIGVYSVEDERTGLLFPGTEESETERFDFANDTGVFRYRRDLGRNSALGVLLTGRSADDYSNLVYGVDGSLRLGRSDTFRFQALGSETEYPQDIQDEYSQPSGTLKDTALEGHYEHEAKHWTWEASYREIGGEFRADSGFVPQAGVRKADSSIWHTWWGDDQRWYSRLRFGGGYDYAETEDGELLARDINIGGRFQGGLQSLVDLRLQIGDQVSEGVLFEDQKGLRLESRFWPTGNLELSLGGSVGDRIDFDHNRQGEELRISPQVLWQPGLHWRIFLEHVFQRLQVDQGRLFSANQSELHLRYQFNRRTFLRAILQYTDIDRDPELYQKKVDSRSQEVFTQLLFSYKLNARTVVFLGYTDSWVSDDRVDLTQASRTLFVKLGYAWLL
jgi:hypothetical protein